jgi:hypothetical protein
MQWQFLVPIPFLLKSIEYRHRFKKIGDKLSHTPHAIILHYGRAAV